MAQVQGTIVQCIGAVTDIEFPREAMPNIYDALVLEETAQGGLVEKGLTFEVEQQLGDGVVRCIALGSSDGLRRGMKVTGTGAPISVPVGKGTLGRIMDVLGRPIDEVGPIKSDQLRSIHARGLDAYLANSMEQAVVERLLERIITRMIDSGAILGSYIGLLFLAVMAVLAAVVYKTGAPSEIVRLAAVEKAGISRALASLERRGLEIRIDRLLNIYSYPGRAPVIVVYVAQMTGGKPLPEPVLDQIVAKTDGVPLFVEELTKTVLESGLLTDAGDHYELAGQLPPLAIPATLHDSLLARLDHLGRTLDPEQRGRDHGVRRRVGPGPGLLGHGQRLAHLAVVAVDGGRLQADALDQFDLALALQFDQPLGPAADAAARRHPGLGRQQHLAGLDEAASSRVSDAVMAELRRVERPFRRVIRTDCRIWGSRSEPSPMTAARCRLRD